MGPQAQFTEHIRQTLGSRVKPVQDTPGLKPAGVLLACYPKNGDYHILFTKRTNRVEHHKGEVSFPGGMKDPGDRTLLDTALRESYEEVGIHPSHVEVLGELDDTTTRSLFRITPFVGTIPSPYPFKVAAIEVADLLEVPVSHLLDRSHFRQEERIEDAVRTVAYFYDYYGTVIFGATARILKQFLDLFFEK